MNRDERIPEVVKRYESDPDGFFDADEYYDIVDYYESVIDTDAAFSVLAKGLACYPDDITLRVELIRFNIATGAYDKAAKLLASMERDPNIKSKDDKLAVRVLKVRLHAEKGELSKLEKDIEKIPQWVEGVNRDDAIAAFSEMVTAMFLSFLYKYAIQALKKGIELFPDEIGFYETLIECHMKEGPDFAEAIKVAEAAIDKDPYNATLWFKLGYINRFDDNMTEALKDFDYATSIDDKYYEAWKAMAECHSKMESYEKAAECYVKAIDPRKDDINLLVSTGDILNNCDKYAEARKYYKQALDIDESKEDALFGIGMSYFLDIDSNPVNFEMAIFWIKRAINEEEHNSLYWNILGECYFALSEWGLALYAYQRAINIKPSQADILAKMGQAYYAVEDYENAVYYLQKSKNLDSDIHTVDISLAASYFNLQEYTKAKYYLMQASERDIRQLDIFLENNPDAAELVENVRKLL